MVWGMPRAVAQAGLCSAVLPLAADWRKDQSSVLGRPPVTPLDYDFLRKCLKERSGLVLSADKQYLVESRLLPVARKAGLGSLGELVATLKRDNAEALMTAVVEAMTTNETFFFRDKAPFENFASDGDAGAAVRRAAPRAPFASGARRPRPARSPTRWPWRSSEMAGDVAGWRIDLIATDLSNGVLEKGAPGNLQPVRSAARAADSAADQVFQPGRRHVADRARNSRHGQIPVSSICCPISPISARSISSSAATC